MSVNKSTSIFFILLALTFKVNDGRKTTTVFDTTTAEIQTLNGRVKLLIDTYDAHESTQIDSITFDPMGSQLRKSTTDFGGFNYGYNYVHKYNVNGRKVEVIVEEIAEGHRVYVYDQSGHAIELITKDLNDTTTTKFKYNAAGNLVQSKMYRSKLISYLTTYKYDKRHLLNEKVGYKGDKFGDKPGYFIKVKYDYKSFDSKGNWTKVIEHYWDRVDSISRKIVYY